MSAAVSMRNANRFSGFLRQRILMLRRFAAPPNVVPEKLFSRGIGTFLNFWFVSPVTIFQI